MNICELVSVVGPSAEEIAPVKEVAVVEKVEQSNIVPDVSDMVVNVVGQGINILVPRKAIKPNVDSGKSEVKPTSTVPPKPRGSAKFFKSIGEVIDGKITHVCYKDVRIKREDGCMDTIREYFRISEEEINGVIVTRSDPIEAPADEEARNLVPKMKDDNQIIDLETGSDTEGVSDDESEKDEFDDFIEEDIKLPKEQAKRARQWISQVVQIVCPAIGDTTKETIKKTILANDDGLFASDSDSEEPLKKKRKTESKKDEIIAETLTRMLQADYIRENLVDVRASLGLPEWESEPTYAFVHENDNVKPIEKPEEPEESKEVAIAKFQFKPRSKPNK